MTRVDFAFNADARVAQAARSTLKHVARGARLFVYCDDPERLNAFDQALWTVEDTGFVPHEPLTEASMPMCRSIWLTRPTGHWWPRERRPQTGWST